MVLSVSADMATTGGGDRAGMLRSRPHPVTAAPNPDRQPPASEPASQPATAARPAAVCLCGDHG